VSVALDFQRACQAFWNTFGQKPNVCYMANDRMRRAMEEERAAQRYQGLGRLGESSQMVFRTKW
jgi:hypothetical protein